MVTRDIEIERRLRELKDIVKRFNHIVCNYIDCFEAIDGTLVEGEDAGDINKETVDFYVNQVNEILANMPPVDELQDFLFKFDKSVEEKDTSEEETITKNLAELEELVISVRNDLCTIDNIDECLCPNNDKDIMDYLTPEQWNERQQIMNSLYWTICEEFPWLIKEEELKRHNIK